MKKLKQRGGWVLAMVLAAVLLMGAASNFGLLQTDDGTAAGPAYSFTNDTDTGFFRSATNTLDVAVAGASDWQFEANLLEAQTGSVLDLNGVKMDIDADADTSLTADTDDQIDIEIAGSDQISITTTTLGLGGTLVDQDLGTENIGVLPTIASAAIISTTSGAIFTVSDGEIWLVHDVLVRVTTNFDCTGDDCTLIIGDGNDTNGLIDLVDAEMQSADTEGTGFAAGWQGMSQGTRGVYLNETGGAGDFTFTGGFIYAPSGADETIDAVVGGTSPAAGDATVYIVYTRLQ